MMTKRLVLGLPLLTTACALFNTDPELRLDFAVQRRGEVAEGVLRTPEQHGFRFLLEVAVMDPSPETRRRLVRLRDSHLQTPVRLWVTQVGASTNPAVIDGVFQNTNVFNWNSEQTRLLLTMATLGPGSYRVRAEALADIPALQPYKTALIVQPPRYH